MIELLLICILVVLLEMAMSHISGDFHSDYHDWVEVHYNPTYQRLS